MGTMSLHPHVLRACKLTNNVLAVLRFNVTNLLLSGGHRMYIYIQTTALSLIASAVSSVYKTLSEIHELFSLTTRPNMMNMLCIILYSLWVVCLSEIVRAAILKGNLPSSHGSNMEKTSDFDSQGILIGAGPDGPIFQDIFAGQSSLLYSTFKLVNFFNSHEMQNYF